MSRIHVLDQMTVDKIAAGEVVERPASVVKELTENAIDAGGTRITVEIRDGGISLIRVTDNGGGIEPEDIPNAFLRHATSKIRDAADLSALASLGFRGEALSSIAAVSRVEMITKQPDELSAVRYLIEGGREKLCEEIGAPDGTTIIVRDLFYNTPARAKFLKTPLTESSHVGAYVEQLALSNPQIAFNFIVNGRTRLATSGNGSLTDVICQVYGREIVRETVKAEGGNGAVRITGLIGKPSLARGNRNFENYYVNGRYLKSRVLQKAIEDGYGTKLMNHQYPFTCLMLSIDSSVVDVNVHPTKMDVRFSDEKAVYEAVRDTVEYTLRNLDMIIHASAEAGKKTEKKEESQKTARPSEVFEERRIREEAEQKSEQNPEQNSERNPAEAREMAADENPAETQLPEDRKPQERTVPGTQDSAAAESEKLLRETLLRDSGDFKGSSLVRDERTPSSKSGRFVQQTFEPVFLSREAKPFRRIVGQVFQTYWICEFDDAMYLFDQHAAHEKVLFEKLMKQYAERSMPSQELMPAMIVSLNAREEQVLLSAMDAFSAIGFDIEPFGERDYAVRAVPYSLVGIDSADLFRQLLDDLEPEMKADPAGEVERIDAYVHRVATEACKAAVKGGERISVREAEQLLDDLMALDDPYHCPHGRPTIISFTRRDLEKRFKRLL